MKDKKLTLNMKWLLSPVSFLLLFALFGSILSVFKIEFNLLLIFSALISLVTTYFLFRKRNTLVELTGTNILYLASSTIVASVLFILRLNWTLFDFICPTGLLGAVTEISKGTFPAPFLSFPDIVMNYHQGFMFIAGALSHITSLNPATSLNILYIVCFVLVTLLLTLYFLSIKNKYYLLPIFLLVFISSISTQYFFDIGWANYVNVFEYLTSNSWPLAILGILLLLFWMTPYQNTRQTTIGVFLIVLSLSTINATVFSVILISSFLFMLMYVRRDRKNVRLLILFLVALAALFIIPKFLPSVFLIGHVYDSPHYTIKILEYGIKKYILNMGRYLFFLSSLLTVFASVIAFIHIKRRERTILQYLSVALLVSYFFPAIILFSNINAWDNIHKFALLNIFLSILVIVLTLPLNIRFFSKKVIYILIGISILGSGMANYDLFVNRTSLAFNQLSQPDQKVEDIVSSLKAQDNKKMLIPYENDIGGMCDISGFSAIAQYSGYSLKYSYFDNFLLNENIERQNQVDSDWWKEDTTFKKTVDGLSEDEYIIVSNKNKEVFSKKIESSRNKTDTRKIIPFNNYLIY